MTRNALHVRSVRGATWVWETPDLPRAELGRQGFSPLLSTPTAPLGTLQATRDWWLDAAWVGAAGGRWAGELPCRRRA